MRNLIGIIFCIVGAVLLVRFSNQEETVVTAHQILLNVQTATFVVYILLEVSLFLFILFLHERVHYVRVVTILVQVCPLYRNQTKSK